jgi:hypothetical protein
MSERTIKDWKAAITFWKVTAERAVSCGLELEAKHCLRQAEETEATMEAWERDAAEKSEEAAIFPIDIGVRCPVCKRTTSWFVDDLFCGNRDCVRFGVKYELPTIYLRRK